MTESKSHQDDTHKRLLRSAADEALSGSAKVLSHYSFKPEIWREYSRGIQRLPGSQTLKVVEEAMSLFINR